MTTQKYDPWDREYRGVRVALGERIKREGGWFIVAEVEQPARGYASQREAFAAIDALLAGNAA